MAMQAISACEDLRPLSLSGHEVPFAALRAPTLRGEDATPPEPDLATEYSLSAGITSLTLENVEFFGRLRDGDRLPFQLRHLTLDYTFFPEEQHIIHLFQDTLRYLSISDSGMDLSAPQRSALVAVAPQLTALALPCGEASTDLRPFLAACTALSHFTSTCIGASHNLPFLNTSLSTLTIERSPRDRGNSEARRLLRSDLPALSKLRTLEIAGEETKFWNSPSSAGLAKECARREIELVWT